MITLNDVLNATEEHWLEMFNEKVKLLIEEEQEKFNATTSVRAVLELLIEKNKNSLIKVLKKTELYQQLISQEKERVQIVYEIFTDFKKNLNDPIIAKTLNSKRGILIMKDLCDSLNDDNVASFFKNYKNKNFLISTFRENFQNLSEKYKYFQPSQFLPNGQHCLASLDTWCQYIDSNLQSKNNEQISEFFKNNKDLNKTFRTGILDKFENALQDPQTFNQYEKSPQFFHLVAKDIMFNFIQNTNEETKRNFFSVDKNNNNNTDLSKKIFKLFDTLLKGINLSLNKYEAVADNDIKMNYLKMLEMVGDNLSIEDYLSIIIATDKFLIINKTEQIKDENDLKYQLIFQTQDYLFNRLINENKSLNIKEVETMEILYLLNAQFEKFKKEKEDKNLIQNYLIDDNLLHAKDVDTKTIAVSKHNFKNLLIALSKEDLIKKNKSSEEIIIHNVNILLTNNRGVITQSRHYGNYTPTSGDKEYDTYYELEITVRFPGCSKLTAKEIITSITNAFINSCTQTKDDFKFDKNLEQEIREMGLNKLLKENSNIPKRNIPRHKV